MTAINLRPYPVRLDRPAGPVEAGADVSVSPQSRVGLNAANFFLAEILGVAMPFLARFLTQHHWEKEAIGTAAAVAGLGVFLMQTPAGFLVDRVRQRRGLLAGASLVVGVCYFLVPRVPSHWAWVDPLLFLGGVAQSFFAPLLGALALGLVGHAALNRTLGRNQGWNHAGNIAAALLAMCLVGGLHLGTAAVFYAVAAVSALAAGLVFLIRGDELDPARASGASAEKGDGQVGILALFRDRRVVILFAATALFHLANAPVMPLVGMYVTDLGGTEGQVAAVVLVAQVVMIPVALLAGWLCDRWGRKPAFALGFLALPLRIFLYSLTHNPWGLVALQALDGIGAGVYGVVVVAVCADLTRGKGRFNALQGLIATALSAGGVIGPLLAGFLVQYLDYAAAFYVFAGIAALAAVVFIGFMPETRPARPAYREEEGRRGKRR